MIDHYAAISILIILSLNICIIELNSESKIWIFFINANRKALTLCLLSSTAFQPHWSRTSIPNFECRWRSKYQSEYIFYEIVWLYFIWGLKKILKPCWFLSLYCEDYFTLLLCGLQPLLVLLNDLFFSKGRNTTERNLFFESDF